MKILLKCIVIFCVSQTLKMIHKYRISFYSFITIIYTLFSHFNNVYKILFYRVHNKTFHRKPLYLCISIYYSQNPSGWIKCTVFDKFQKRFLYKKNLCFNYPELISNFILQELLQQTWVQMQYIIFIYCLFQVTCSLKLFNCPICHDKLIGDVLFKVSLTKDNCKEYYKFI